eukprot:144945-Hanusia_phi.AAC.1
MEQWTRNQNAKHLEDPLLRNGKYLNEPLDPPPGQAAQPRRTEPPAAARAIGSSLPKVSRIYGPRLTGPGAYESQSLIESDQCLVTSKIVVYSTKKGTRSTKRSRELKQIHLRIELGESRGSKRSYTEPLLPPEKTSRGYDPT